MFSINCNLHMNIIMIIVVIYVFKNRDETSIYEAFQMQALSS